MKLIFKNALYRLFFFVGVYVIRLPSSFQFKNIYDKKPIEVQEYEFNRITLIASLANNHKYFEALLKQYVPEYKDNKKIKKSEFIGVGIGGSSLNAFRKVKIDNKIYFEKIYFSRYQDIEVNLWFSKHVREKIKSEIMTPKIVRIFRGDLITVVWFEYKELHKLPKVTEFESIIDLSKKLYDITPAVVECFTDAPSFITKFRNHFEYMRGIKLLNVAEENLIIRLDFFENKARKSMKVLTHGDLQPTNVYKENNVIDWDAFGFFPIGFEQAFICFRSISDGNEIKSPEEWLNHYFKICIRKENWFDFERNFFFFLYIFLVKWFYSGKKMNLQNILFKKLNTYT